MRRCDEASEEADASLREKEFLMKFKRLRYRDVLESVKELQETEQEMTTEWEKEVLMYSRTMPFVETPDDCISPELFAFPRRNYKNREGLVKDCSLFPYHTAFYPLLDCYDGLAELHQNTPANSTDAIVEPSGRSENFAFSSPTVGSLGCSDEAICEALMSREDIDNWVNYNHRDLFQPNLQHADAPHDDLESNWFMDANPQPRPLFGWHRLLEGEHAISQDERQDLLLKLLRHSLCDFHDDIRLARIILLRMIDEQCFNDPKFLKKFLVIVITTEKRCCTTGCPPNCHHEEFGDTMPWFIARGITFFTREHALLIAAAMKHLFDLANPSAAALEEKLMNNDRCGLAEGLSLRRHLLKQQLYVQRNTEEYEDEHADETDKLDYSLLNDFARGLGRKAVTSKFEGLNIQKQSPSTAGTSDEEESPHVDSFLNCVNTLVFCAELGVRRCPVNWMAQETGGRIVRSLVEAYLEPSNRSLYCVDDQSYLGHVREELKGSGLLNYSRYIDLMPKSLQDVEDFNRKSQSIPSVDLRPFDHPTRDVIDALRCLFSRGLVNNFAAGCGWGDVIVFLRLPFSAGDPLLFDHQHNYAMEEEEDGSCSVVFDEMGELISAEHVRARYDFALLMLRRFIAKSWSPATHYTFSRNFRLAVNSIFRTAHRVGMPTEIAFKIAEFMPRCWWSDDLAHCWCDDCLHDDPTQLMNQKVSAEDFFSDRTRQRRKLEHMVYCGKCVIASFKSDSHRRSEASAHECSVPPLKCLGREEEALCRTVLGNDEKQEHVAQLHVAISGTEGDDDDSSWESIDSDEEDGEPDEGESVNALLYKYFEKHNYSLYSDEED